MTADVRSSTVRLWISAAVPLVLLALLVAVIVKTKPGDMLRGSDVPPPVERLSIDRARLGPDGIILSVLNDGPDPVTIAQVTVDDAYWAFSASKGTVLQHLDRTALTIPYPWVSGEAHLVRILTSTGTRSNTKYRLHSRHPVRTQVTSSPSR